MAHHIVLDIERLEERCGPASFASVVNAFIDSPEFRTLPAQSVEERYHTILHRQASPSEATAWDGQGLSGSQLAAALATSAEYVSAMGLDDPIEALYEDLLRRAPDQQGYNDWRSLIGWGLAPAPTKYTRGVPFTYTVHDGFAPTSPYAGLVADAFARWGVTATPIPWTPVTRASMDFDFLPDSEVAFTQLPYGGPQESTIGTANPQYLPPVVQHETGIALGLDETTNPADVMFYVNSFLTVPSLHDRAELSWRYGR